MGSWQLEVFKMFLYITFPVLAFHVFNQPEVFEQWMEKSGKEVRSLVSQDYVEKFKKVRLERQTNRQQDLEQ